MLDQIMNIPGVVNPCIDAATITSITKTVDELLACNGSSSGWHLLWTLNISGTLQAGQEYYWEVATDGADGWGGEWRRGTSTTQHAYDAFVGSDGPGSDLDRYHRVRVYVVPVGESPPDECNGPTLSEQASRTAASCAA